MATGRYEITKYKKDTAHTAHIIATVCTFGLWGMVYIPLAIGRAIFKKKMITYYE